ncbi:septum formation initiator family protein [bacterium]|nr:septum formation initiator family protein [bacterium]
MPERTPKSDVDNQNRFLRLSDENRKKMWKGAQTTLFILIAMIMILLLFGGDFGLISIYKYQRYEKQIAKQIGAEKARQDSLKQALMDLNANDEFKERLAREKLRMLKDGEIIYRFEPQEIE